MVVIALLWLVCCRATWNRPGSWLYDLSPNRGIIGRITSRKRRRIQFRQPHVCMCLKIGSWHRIALNTWKHLSIRNQHNPKKNVSTDEEFKRAANKWEFILLSLYPYIYILGMLFNFFANEVLSLLRCFITADSRYTLIANLFESNLILLLRASGIFVSYWKSFHMPIISSVTFVIREFFFIHDTPMAAFKASSLGPMPTIRVWFDMDRQ